MHLAHGGITVLAIVSASIRADIGSRKTRHGAGFQMYVRRTMKNLILRAQTALRNYAKFVITRNEIARLPLDIALDLGIYRGDADKIARQSVYG
ncbi:hypothetical protein EGN72_13910 [Pseudorhodobacter sp. E13]|nr:hypothetical protein EGN72_13910 [Pseudorhodobacter sp. E13]